MKLNAAVEWQRPWDLQRGLCVAAHRRRAQRKLDHIDGRLACLSVAASADVLCTGLRSCRVFV